MPIVMGSHARDHGALISNTKQPDVYVSSISGLGPSG